MYKYVYGHAMCVKNPGLAEKYTYMYTAWALLKHID